MTYYMSDYVKSALMNSRRIVSYLNIFGYLSIVLTLITVASAVYIIVLSSRAQFLGSAAWGVQFFREALLVMGVAATSAILVVAAHDQLNRRARSMQSLLADIIQNSLNSETRSSMDDIESKFAIRSLAVASDLPLVPGRYGPAVYAGINLFVGFAALSLTFG